MKKSRFGRKRAGDRAAGAFGGGLWSFRTDPRLVLCWMLAAFSRARFPEVSWQREATGSRRLLHSLRDMFLGAKPYLPCAQHHSIPRGCRIPTSVFLTSTPTSL